MVIDLGEWNWWFWQSPADLFETWRYLNWLMRSILVVLLVMLAHTLLTTVVVAVRHAVARRQSRRFVRVTEEPVESGRLEEVLISGETFKKSHIAAVMTIGFGAFRSTPLTLSPEEAQGCAERAMQRTASMKLAEMRLGLGSLKTIAVTVPLLGVLGTLLGVLDSLRGGNFSYWSWLMLIAGGNYIALLFTALSLLVAVLSMWSHDWLAFKSGKLESEMQDAALATIKQIGAHPEFRGASDNEISLPWEAGRSARQGEVPYDRHTAVLVPVSAVVLYFFYILWRGIWQSPDLNDAVRVVLLLFAAGVIALSIWFHRSGIAAWQDYRSIERRRKVRLPLRERFASLPDRSAFTFPIAAALAVMMLINDLASRVPHGIPVELAVRESLGVVRAQEKPMVVQVRKKFGRSYAPVPLFRVQGKLIEEGELRAYLERELARQDERLVVVYGDRELRFQTMAKVMDLVNQLGGTPVMLGSRESPRR